MDVSFNPPYYNGFFYNTYPDYISSNLSSPFSQVDIAKMPRLTSSPWSVTLAVLLVFICSPMILIGNSLLLVATYRFKRLRTPSNYLVMSLATSDLGIGMFMPVGMYLEVGGGVGNPRTVRVCLVSYGVAISLCSVSVLVMVAIAVDRFTSLARPLRYNNLITHSAVERYIAVFWAYSSLVGFTPLGFSWINGVNYRNGDCSFGALVAKPVQLFMFCAVYGPSALVLLVCYGYIYFIARGHARAISEVRHSLHHPSQPGPPRYGLALAITTGMFVGLWMPFQLCMLVDVFLNTHILSGWVVIYLSLPILASSAINPWIYGYRNAELRCAVRRVIDDFLATLGFTYQSHRHDHEQVPPSAVVTAGDPASFINHVQRECYSFNKGDGDLVLVPIAKPECSDVESERSKVMLGNGLNSMYFRDRPKILRNSKSMIESFAVSRSHKGGSAVVIKSTEMIHGVSIV